MTTPLVQQIKSTFDESGITAAVAALRRYNKAVLEASNSGKKLNSVADSLKRIGQIASGIVISRGLLSLGQAFTDGVKNAAAFEKAVSEISTIARNSGRDFEGLASGVREISDALGIDILTVAEAEYQTLSNQVVAAADSFDFLETAARLATATVSSNASAVSALSSVLNSFNLPASSAEEISAKLFKTIELGRVRMEELGNILGRVTPLSASLGVSFDETTAAIAALTQVGIRAAEATTLLSNVQLKLIKPTDTLKKSVEGLGAANSQVLISAFGFEGALKKIAGTTAGTAEEFGALFGRVRALRGALSLSSERAKDFEKALKDIGATSSDTLDEAFDKVFQTNAKQVEVEINKIKNLFTVDFGRAFINVIASISEVLGGASGAFEKLTIAVTATGVAFGLFHAQSIAGVVASIPGLIAGIGGVTGALVALETAVPILAIAAGVGALGAVFLEQQRLAKETAEQAKKSQADQLKADITVATKNAQIRREATQRNIGDIQLLLLAQEQLSTGFGEIARSISDIGIGGLSDQIQSRIKGYEQLIESLRDAGIEAREAFLGIRDVTRDVNIEVDDIQFRNRIQFLTEEQKIRLTIQRAEEKFSASRAAALKGEKGLAETLNRQARSLAEQARSRAVGTKNQQLTSQIDARQVAILQGRIGLEQDIAKGLAKRGVESNKLAGKIRTELNLLRERAKLLKPLEGGDQAAIFDTKESAETIKAQFGEVGVELQKSVEALQKRLQEGFRQRLIDPAALAELSAEFENTLTGQTGNISSIARQNFDALVDAANKGVESLDPKVKKLLGEAKIELAFDVQGIQVQLQTLGKLLETISAQTETFEAATARIPDNFKTIQGNLQSLQRLNRTGTRGGGARILDENIERRLKQVQETVTRIQGTDFELLKPEDFARAVEQVNGLENVIATSTRKGIDKFRGQFSETIDQIRQDINTSLTLKDDQDFLKRQQDLFQNFRTLNQSQIDASRKILTNAELTTAETLKQLANIQQAAALRPGAQAAQFFGGRPALRRAFGGAVGQDSVNVLASPGEGFLTAKAMRKFFPVVQAANSGRQPVLRENGGSVTTVHGDTNITVNEASTPQATLREITRGLNRQKRTRTGILR